jgi:hypothetical protein
MKYRVGVKTILDVQKAFSSKTSTDGLGGNPTLP